MGTLVIQELFQQEDMILVAGLDIIGEGKPLIEGVSVMHSSKSREVLSLIKPDVLIDFTEPNAALQNVLDAADIGIDLVVGTTGFKQEQIAQMRKAVEGNVAAVISPNFSLGVNVFWKLIALAVETLKGYDIEVIEAHHNLKKDAPSGTALAALEILKKTLGTVEVVSGRQGIHLRGKEIGVHAIRAGDIVGDHTVLFAGPGERLEIKHQAHNRMAFASGAIKAARWVTSAKPGIYNMGDVLGS
jgi:4-hydroxy-tetrahydrodipicolinate reductase